MGFKKKKDIIQIFDEHNHIINIIMVDIFDNNYILKI